jgi:hypothetical protein
VSTDRDTTHVVRSWLGDGVTALPDRVLDAVLEEVSVTPQRRPWWLAWRPFIMSNAVRIALVAAAAAVVAVVGISLLQPSGGVGGPTTTESPSPSHLPSPPESARIIGLPPEGATPSNPDPGELVLRFEGNVNSPGSTIWVYRDGRLIWNRFHYVPPEAGDAFIGLVEQRLTPSGVQFLLSEVISTGLFESDLALAREGSAPFLDIQVRNGDQFVRATWAVRDNFRIGQSAPVATQEQATALSELSALLTDPVSWPASAWLDRTIRPYVPSSYSVCFRGVPEAINEPAQVLELLPQPAAEMLRFAEPAQETSVPANGDCSRVTTDDAGALAQIFESAGTMGIERSRPENGAYWLRYVLPDEPVSGNDVWISFAPVLPHGEGTWLGPG